MGNEMEFKYVHKGDQLVFNNYYSIPEDPLLFISMAGRTTPRASYRISRQDTFKQHFYVMEYVVSGKGHIRYDEKEYSVGAGDFYLLNTVHKHSYYADEKEPFEKIWINVYRRLIDSLCQAFRFEPLLIRKVNVEEDILRIHQMLQGKNSDEVEEMSDQFGAELTRLLYKVYNSMNARLTGSNRLRIIKDYIRRHITDGITVEKICEANYISTASLFRLFKENTGESPKEYIGKIKIQMAATILRNTDIEIAEIGKQLGYYDYSHFYKSFTAAKGLSPAMYRKKYR